MTRTRTRSFSGDSKPQADTVAVRDWRTVWVVPPMWGSDYFAVLRIVARAALDPPQRWDRFDARFDGIRADAVRVLKANVPDVKHQELILRVRCVAGLLNWLAVAPVSAELGNKSETQLERLLVPTIAGAFRGARSS